MSPLSAVSAPERTLISVDLPAPLSPSSPTISLWLTVKVTSLSAWTRPKHLLICSMRTSSAAIFSYPRVVSAFEPGVKGHHAQNNRANENVIGQTGDANQDNAVAHQTQNQNAED